MHASMSDFVPPLRSPASPLAICISPAIWLSCSLLSGCCDSRYSVGPSAGASVILATSSSPGMGSHMVLECSARHSTQHRYYRTTHATTAPHYGAPHHIICALHMLSYTPTRPSLEGSVHVYRALVFPASVVPYTSAQCTSLLSGRPIQCYFISHQWF